MKINASRAGSVMRRDPDHWQESETNNPIGVAVSNKQVVLGGENGSF